MILTAQDVAQMLQFGLIAWLSVVVVYVMYSVFRHGHALNEMLLNTETARIAPERVASLVIILGVAGFYILTGLSGDYIYDAATDHYWLPDIPQSLLIALAGGESIFIAGKISRSIK